MKGLNFAPTPRWTPKMEREEWYNAQTHTRNVEWHDVFGDDNDDEIKREVPDKLKLSNYSRPDRSKLDDKTVTYSESVSAKMRNLEERLQNFCTQKRTI